MSPADDARWMRLAIDASAQALAAGNRPFGAVLVRDGAMLLSAANNQATSGDFTGHAEMVLVRTATAKFGTAELAGATVYASGEPCAMCAGALYWAGIGRIVFAASTADINRCLGGPALPIGCAAVLEGARPPVHVEGPLLRAAAVAVLEAAAMAARAKPRNDRDGGVS